MVCNSSGKAKKMRKQEKAKHGTKAGFEPRILPLKGLENLRLSVAHPCHFLNDRLMSFLALPKAEPTKKVHSLETHQNNAGDYRLHSHQCPGQMK
ncbi:hypothetical protein SUGI_0819000 [Cryptomeria japonica]|nr:hypothetical protein SUGI_0819000 [Cryptomeria japonica]